MLSLDAEAFATQLREWRAGMAQEIAFWSHWIHTRGSKWGWEFQQRLDPNSTVEPIVGRIIDRIGRKRISVLDVGAGPMTWVGKHYLNYEIVVSACDPLADVYRHMLRRAGIQPPVHTEFAMAEDLDLRYEAGQFCIVCCRNALDHSFDPVRGVIQMLRACRVGGCVLLKHIPNEGENAHYEGLHKWNFSSSGQNMMIWNPHHSFNVSESVSLFAHSEVHSADGYITNALWKTGEVPASLLSDNTLRYFQLQRAFVELGGSGAYCQDYLAGDGEVTRGQE